MFDSLPVNIDPIRLADEGFRLSGHLPLGAMRRLAALCRDDRASVAVDLAFTRDAQGLREMRGTIETEVGATCQRCLQEVRLPLRAEPALLVLRPGQQGRSGDDADALVVEGPVMLASLVEDELLLCMPMIPMHAEGECEALAYRDAEGESPFAALGRLKRKEK